MSRHQQNAEPVREDKINDLIKNIGKAYGNAYNRISIGLLVRLLCQKENI